MAHYKVTENESGKIRLVRAESERHAKDHVFDQAYKIETVKGDAVIDLIDSGVKREKAGEPVAAAVEGDEAKKDGDQGDQAKA